ncbi:hypothetical protein EVAR_96150_1 [Eumeta japonica]|uniref:Uncharacterized protein n=1 Tax=Eumeta variegata TaxID=151549 RepID=A0A4C1VHF7_EUMVA|nr:hypothetical protein EVAR_96150_1 [Eumeta japonica]
MHKNEYQSEIKELVNEKDTHQVGSDLKARLQDLGNKLVKNVVEKGIIDVTQELEDTSKLPYLDVMVWRTGVGSPITS